MPRFLNSLFGRVVIGLLIGVVVGVLFPHFGESLRPFGDGFLKLIKMIIAPIVFCVVVSGMASAPRTPDSKAKSNPSALGELTDAHRVVATVVEMVHMATLVHDDVLDEAELRRKGATINHLRGNEAAVLLGD